MIKFLTVLAILSTSWDRFGAVNIGGFNFRFTQFIYSPVLFFYTLKALFYPDRVKLSRGGGGMLLWVLVNLIFIANSPNIKNAVGYFFWLIFNVMTVLSMVLFTDKEYSGKWLIRFYMNSFYIMALIGLAQFFLYFLGINFFAAQHGAYWTRINGFSYEPSYYSTYMLPGFVMFSYLSLKNDHSVFTGREVKLRYYVITFTLFLCSSKLGWGLILLWFIISLRFVNGSKRLKILLGIMISVIIAVWFLFLITGMFNVNFLNGLGLFGTASHSSMDRWRCFLNCIEVFKDHPLIGYSLGGVDPILAQYAGRAYSTLNNGAGNCVGELLVASGIIGIIPFIYFLYKLLKNPLKRNNVYTALVYGLMIEMLSLVFNQNILRPYAWMHVAVLCSLYKHFRNTTALQNSREHARILQLPSMHNVQS